MWHSILKFERTMRVGRNRFIAPLAAHGRKTVVAQWRNKAIDCALHIGRGANHNRLAVAAVTSASPHSGLSAPSPHLRGR
jgi:hypothetical protein